MKIHYLSTHTILEYDEVKLLTELGHEVFSNGAYLDPKGSKTLPRPGIEGAQYFPEYEAVARQFPKTNLPKELIDPFDMIIVMHTPEWIAENWDRMKHKIVVWRSIGQSTRHVENMIRRMRYEGMKIIRYSPLEQNIQGYLGADAIIRFYKDPEEFKDWNGNVKRVMNMTQSLKARRFFCHYDEIMEMMNGFPGIIYGTGNDDLGPLNGGDVPFEILKGQLRDNRVFVYGGTWPASYTLAFIEAWMTGIPIVAIGKRLAEDIQSIPAEDRIAFYEIPSLMQNGVNGFFADNVEELRQRLHELLENQELAKRIGDAGRQRAIEIFGKETIKEQWRAFLSHYEKAQV